MFSNRPDSVTVTFKGNRPDDAYMRKLRAEFKLDDVVAGARGDYGRVRAICNWVRGRWEHNGNNEPEHPDPISILEEAAQGKQFRCVEYAIVLDGVLNSLGIPARFLALKTKDAETRGAGAGHVVAEAYLRDQKKWIMIDGQFDVIPILHGKPLNAVELQRALAEGSAGLSLDSLADTEPENYFDWIAPYLFYFDVRLDARYGVDREPGGLMLVPIGASNPTVFQRKWPIKNMTYTHSLPTFYQSPE